jgi:hypothetical protein
MRRRHIPEQLPMLNTSVGAWVAAGRPLMQESTNGLLGRHPLWRVMLEAEAHAMRFRAELGLSPRSAKSVIRRGPGRPVGVVSAPDRVTTSRFESREPDRRPRVQLRSVGMVT